MWRHPWLDRLAKNIPESIGSILLQRLGARRRALDIPAGLMLKFRFATHPLMPRQLQRWDVFCSVVDNYGDAGVCWRLARQLVEEHDVAVRLFVDALPSLARIAPAIDASLDEQTLEGVRVSRWLGPKAEAVGTEVANVVVEAFGCGLPRAYMAAMAALGSPPMWINLEYLSAETWIEGCHELSSRHPTLPLTRHFFFPGFTAASGGLLRERDLLARRDAFQGDANAQSSLWHALRIPPPEPQVRVVSLFCYASAPLLSLLDAWSKFDVPIVCLVPEGVAASPLDTWSNGGLISAGQQHRHGPLTVARVPFLDQDGYDRLLWSCDVNFVRGEDSFVRSQWAARPLVWQPYVQRENAHRLKLDAFLDRYAAGLARDAAEALRGFSHAWIGDGEPGTAWEAFASALPALATQASAWSARLGSMPDLAANLVRFCADRV
jgi:uncharacterized repeat protein (TIGR03837 family)